MSDKELLRYVTYCGLYCGLCAHKNLIPQRAGQLQKTLHEEGFDFFYQFGPDRETVPVFWALLRKFSEMDSSCRTGCGPPNCEIRTCAKRRGVEVCPQCSEYPCSLIERMAEHYPNLIQDGKHLQKVGSKEWIKKQEERAKRGVVYADLRIP